MTALALTLALTLPLPLGPQTADQLDAWLESWEARAVEGLDAATLDELRTMTAAHPWYFTPQTSPETTTTTVAEQVFAEADSAPAAAPAPATTPRSTRSGVERWRELVAAFFDPGDVDRALCLMGFESGGDPTATNPTSGAAGLFQIMPFWWEAYGGDRYDPTDNVAMAARILDEQGWTAWSPYNRGECR